MALFRNLMKAIIPLPRRKYKYPCKLAFKDNHRRFLDLQVDSRRHLIKTFPPMCYALMLLSSYLESRLELCNEVLRTSLGTGHNTSSISSSPSTFALRIQKPQSISVKSALCLGSGFN